MQHPQRANAYEPTRTTLSVAVLQPAIRRQLAAVLASLAYSPSSRRRFRGDPRGHGLPITTPSLELYHCRGSRTSNVSRSSWGSGSDQQRPLDIAPRRVGHRTVPRFCGRFGGHSSGQIDLDGHPPHRRRRSGLVAAGDPAWSIRNRGRAFRGSNRSKRAHSEHNRVHFGSGNDCEVALSIGWVVKTASIVLEARRTCRSGICGVGGAYLAADTAMRHRGYCKNGMSRLAGRCASELRGSPSEAISDCINASQVDSRWSW